MDKEQILQDVDLSKSKELLISVISTLESDRKRIAQNLHDDIGSKLNVISINCHLLKIPNLPQKDIEDITKTIIEYTSKALSSCKKLTHSLLPPVLERFGLHAGIEELCVELRDNENVVIEYLNSINFDFADNDKHIHVFRILQELLANSIQDRKATSIKITFNEVDGKKTCNYSDNGFGFDPNEQQSHSKHVMINIESRIVTLNGQLFLGSQIDTGISLMFNF